NIAPAMAETDLFSHIKHMLWDTLPAFFLSILMYWIVSNSPATSSGADTNVIDTIKTGLDNVFLIHPLLLLMPVLTIFLMIIRTPAIPALMGVSLLGGVLAIFVQGSSVSAIIQVMTSGYSVESGTEALDSLLNRGGIMSMLGTIALLIIATALGGILEETGSFEVLTRKMMQRVKTTGTLISSTILSTFVVAFASGAQFLAIILPARTFV
ncbi:Na+/H+ antiporter NhaC family protein, partial [Cytobacillus praedii]|uniref:Na+/H+ antiporter NhaC family protein n=2 Tax=Cytobacillus praedii TaxID=1742358 RepID=UPI003F808CAE